jgi:hypothetical protein
MTFFPLAMVSKALGFVSRLGAVAEPALRVGSTAQVKPSGFVGAKYLVVLAALCLLPTFKTAATPQVLAAPSTRPAMSPLGGPQLFFEPFASQSAGPLRFLARGRNCAFLIESARIQLALRKSHPDDRSRLRLRHELMKQRVVETVNVEIDFLAGDTKALICGEGEMPGKANYLVGNDPARWRTSVPTYAKVRVGDLYPGVDLDYYVSNQQLEYDFTVAPGVDPGLIAMRFGGVKEVSLSDAGELVLKSESGEVRQRKPVLYQMDGARRIDIDGGYRITDLGNIAFVVGAYDKQRPLIIDPVLAYSTYFGGNSDDLALAVKVDSAGSVYVTGQTLSTTFPFALPTNGVQRTFGGGSANGDAFVAKLDNTGKNLIYFTYVGGSSEDGGLDLAVDPAGDAYITGFTLSPDFPTRNALFPQIGGSAIAGLFEADGFVSELNSNGSAFVYSTYLGGTNADVADGIDVDNAGNAYITGSTSSGDFPTRYPLAGQTTFLGGIYDGFVTKIAPQGTNLVYSTYLGGPGTDEGMGIAADSNGFAYVTGLTVSTNFPITTNAFQTILNNGDNTNSCDAFVTKFSPTGALVYSTFLGGAYNDYGYRIRIDGSGNSYVTGPSLSPDFPNTITNVPGLSRYGNSTNPVVSFDAFLAKLDSNGGLVYSTIFGGTSQDTAWDVAVDPSGNAFIVGNSYSVDFLTTNVFAPFTSINNGISDVFVTAINSNATALFYSAYLGGAASDIGYGIAVDAEDSAYIVGQTSSPNFPVTSSPLQAALDSSNDSFLAKIRLADPMLSLVLSGDNLLLEWPITSSGFILESATSLVPPINWVPVAQSPILGGNRYQVTLPATNSSAVFRLFHP